MANVVVVGKKKVRSDMKEVSKGEYLQATPTGMHLRI
jgi:hypothetical protein